MSWNSQYRKVYKEHTHHINMVEPKEEVKEPEKSESQKLKEENDAVEAELLRKETLRAQAAQGGESDAGESDEIPEADKKKVGAKEFFKGTELEEAIDKYNE